MTPSIWQILIILAVVLLLFARPGKISALMGDFGKGLRSFKDGVKGDEEADEPEAIEAPAPKKKAEKKKLFAPTWSDPEEGAQLSVFA